LGRSISGSFEEILQSLVSCQPIKEAIQATVKTRNTLGHNLAWAAASLDAAKYHLLAENIAVSCLHAISCLYSYPERLFILRCAFAALASDVA
jgi:hypothetical protein